jgi:uncharacterized protein
VILYLDTSAFVKLYIEEPGTAAVATEVDRSSAVVTARVTYAEARAAFARQNRERCLLTSELRRIVRHLDDEWGRFNVVEITDPLVRRAGTLAERHGLRGYDAVQLAAALDLRAAGAEVVFASFDARLSRAARREGLHLPVLPG